MVYCFVLVLLAILKNAVWKWLSFVEIRSRDSSPPTSSSPPDHWLRKTRLQEGFQMPLPLQFWNHMKSCCRLCVYLYLMWYFERMNSMPCVRIITLWYMYAKYISIYAWVYMDIHMKHTNIFYQWHWHAVVQMTLGLLQMLFSTGTPILHPTVTSCHSKTLVVSVRAESFQKM